MSEIEAIPRIAWQDPAKPVTGPPPRGIPENWIIHYPGGGKPPIGPKIKEYLRSIQSDYLRTRGYSIGYSWGVGQDGSKWELRGDDINPASNPGRKRKAETEIDVNFNNISRSIFVMVSGDDPATPEAVKAINEIIATEPLWPVMPHGAIDYTSCCGKGLIAQIADGTIGHTQISQPESPLLGVPDMFVPIQPFRNSDTRKYGVPASVGSYPFGLNASVFPANVTAVALNVTVVDPSTSGFITVWPGGPWPEASCVNFAGGVGETSGSVVVGVNGLSGFMIHTSSKAHLIVDVTGYWTP